MELKITCVYLYVQNHTVLAMQVRVPRGSVRAWCQRKVKAAKQFSIRSRDRAHLLSPGLFACLVLVLVLVLQVLISSLAARSNSDFPPCQSYVGIPTGDWF